METFNQIILYLFSPTPPRSFSYAFALAVLAALLFAGAIAMHLYRKKNKDDKAFKKLLRPWVSRLVTLGVLTLLYLACRVYGFPLFSTRILLFALLAAILWSIFRMAKTWTQEYPKAKDQRKERMEKNRYIPRKHKK